MGGLPSVGAVLLQMLWGDAELELGVPRVGLRAGGGRHVCRPYRDAVVPGLAMLGCRAPSGTAELQLGIPRVHLAVFINSRISRAVARFFSLAFPRG